MNTLFRGFFRGFQRALKSLAAGLLLTACGQSPPVALEPASPWPALAAALDSFLSNASPAPSGKVDGYSFILFDKAGIAFERANGDQTLDSVLPLASGSKMPSAAAILSLADQGKLDIDAPIGLYLAGSPVTWPADKAAITMRMLLAHTSGLPGLGDLTSPACLDLETGTTIEQCVQTIASTALVSAPGTEFNYGGADYQVAGYAATLISGETWQDFFAGALGQPLGLTTFTYGDAATVTNPRIAGGASSNAADYVKILQMLQAHGRYGGRQVLSAAVVAALEIDEIAGLPVAYTPFPAGQAANYPGYGFGLWTSAASLYPGSPGPEYSDPGLFGSVPWIDNGLGYGAVLLIDQDVATGLDIWNTVRPIIIQQLRDGAG